MSPEQKSTQIFEIADQLDRVRYMLDAAGMAMEAIADQTGGNAVAVLLAEIADKVTQQADSLRVIR